LTKSLEWNLRYCLMVYLFDRRGQVRKEFVKEKRRGDLVDGLKRRFVFMGCLNLLFSPFIVVYLLIYSFFRYFEVCPLPTSLSLPDLFLTPSPSSSSIFTPFTWPTGLVFTVANYRPADLVGIPQKPLLPRIKTIYPIRPMEIP